MLVESESDQGDMEDGGDDVIAKQKNHMSTVSWKIEIYVYAMLSCLPPLTYNNDKIYHGQLLWEQGFQWK